MLFEIFELVYLIAIVINYNFKLIAFSAFNLFTYKCAVVAEQSVDKSRQIITQKQLHNYRFADIDNDTKVLFSRKKRVSDLTKDAIIFIGSFI